MRVHYAALAVLAVSLAVPAARAQAPNAQPPNADVQALLAKVAKAYKGLTAFSATIETASVGGGDDKLTNKLVFQKPDKLSATIQNKAMSAHVVADGKSVYSDSSTNKGVYVKHAVGTFQEIVGDLQRNGGAGVGLLPILLTSDTLEQRILPGKPQSQKIAPAETVDGVECDVLAVEMGTGDNAARITFAFGKQDHLLRRLSMVPLKAGAPGGLTETYSGVSTTPALTDATFSYTPPAGAKAVDKPVEPPMFDPRIKKGAAPLPFSGADLAGSAVSLSQFKGKVLLIDFWATWCGPCVGELPNVIAAYNKYHAKGFDILGVSLDNAPDKAKLQKFIKDQKMPWRQVYDGKGWKAANAVAWGVQSIPFTVLVGKDGKIAAVGARGPALEPAIQAALAK